MALALVDTAAIIELIRQKPKPEVARLLASLFLVVSSDSPHGAAISFETVAVTARSEGGDLPDPAASGIEIIPIVKAEGNPYPERISVGRARNCDIVFRDASISKLHAHFRVLGGDVTRLEVVDHGSHNGTRVNGQRIAPSTPTPVQSGTAIVFGRLSTKILDAGALHDTVRVLARVTAAIDGKVDGKRA
jgi:hypothetical protein